MFSKEQAFELKSKLDVKSFYKKIVGTIEEYGGKYKTLCPFHNDHNPSLEIDKKTGIWRCWVDRISGDMIDFVERFYGLSFIDAMNYIIKEFDVEIEMSEDAKKQYQINNALIKIHTTVSNFYQKSLLESSEAIEYLKSRKIDSATIKKFKIGFIPQARICNSENLLPLFMRGGLSYENSGNFFSKNRISIPFQDSYGNIVGFTARTIVDDKPKYLHSKTTDIFKKDEILFGFNHAKSSIEETKSVFIVEGQFDCIRAHQFGITNCVALSGLAISDKQINNLKNMCKNYYIILEDSKAERLSKNSKESALDRIYNTIMSNNSWASVKIIKLYNEDIKCDLDDFLLTYGKKEFINKIKHAVTYNEYVLIDKLSNASCKTIEEKSAYIYKIRKYINQIVSPITKNYYIDLLYDKLGFEEIGDTQEERESNRQKNYSIIYKTLSKYSRIDTIEDDIESPITISQKYIIASLFSKFGFYNSYKVLEELGVESVLNDIFLNIFRKMEEIVLKNGQGCDIINLLHSSDLNTESLNIVDSCFFKADELDYLDEIRDEKHNDNLFELREFIEDKIKNLE